MAWSFGKIAMMYFIIGIVLVGSGVIPLASAGLVNEVVGGTVNGEIVENENATDIGSELSGSPQASQDSVFGGSILAALQFGRDIMAFAFWPITIGVETNQPLKVQLILSIPVFGMIIGFARIVRSSI